MYDFSRLLNLMEIRCVSQRRLAFVIGISANAFNNKIQGRSFFNTQEIDRICDALHIKQADIGLYFFTKTKKAE
jgi:DNA-binding Xre family transcriptional regulator